MGAFKNNAVRTCPFVPGWGALPPYLAGREEEQSRLEDRFTRLRAGRNSGTAMVFYGPRGNGKTTMLSWMEDQAGRSGIDVIRFASRRIQSLSSLIQLLQPTRKTGRLSETSISGPTLKLQDKPAETINSALARRLRKKPLVLAIDEAQVLSAEVGQLILPAVLDQIAFGAPLLFVLAGTPDLLRHLSGLEASFWERAEIVPFGRLSEPAAVRAILNPLEQAGWEIEDRAAARLSRDCQGYPFFLQLRGDSLWRHLPAPPGPVTVRDVEASWPVFRAKRELFYGVRFRELEWRSLLLPVSAVARKFRDREFLTRAEILREIEASDRKDPLTSETATVQHVWTELCDLGYVWSATGVRYEPGIPSLMNYIADEVALGAS